MIRYISLLLFIGLAWGQETVTDIDGNVYQTVQIGDQLWMAENLKVTHYNNGDEIQYVQSESSEPNVWANLSTGAYGYYNDDLSHQEIYGNLYNWYAVETGNLAPEGWHVPTDDEIKQLEMYLGMSQEEADGTGHRGTNEGSKLAGMADLWNDGNLVNNPEFGTSGFNLLPGGYRISYGGYYDSMGLVGYFWSSTENSSNYAWNRVLYYYSSDIDRYDYDKKFGFSVRCVRNAQAETIHVPQDYPTIQAGIDAANNGDTVLVAPGTYVENITYNDTNIVVGSLFLTTSDTSYISSTIIDGNQSGRVVTFDGLNEENSSGELNGFTITNGNGGIYCIETPPVSLSNLIITQNTATEDGGGIRIIYDSNATLSNVTISGNSTGGRGGGIFVRRSNVIITNATINDNFSGYSGGGIFVSTSGSDVVDVSLTLINVTIAGNTAGTGGHEWDDDGGGLYIYDMTPTMVNSIIWNNQPTQVDMGYSYFFESSLNAQYSDIEGGWAGEGNIDANPLFCDTPNGDYTLAENSPCIGTGDNGANMGALGIGCGAILSTDVDLIPVQFALNQNYPNPFNPVTTLRYELPENAMVNITIYDMMGRVVSNLVSSQQTAGYKSVQWNATNNTGQPVSAGIYLYTIDAGQFRQTKKMVLLK